MGAFLFLLGIAAAPAATTPADLDRRCYALMTELAESEDARAARVGRTAAFWFLGRIDAVGGSAPEEAAPQSSDDRRALLGACAEAIRAAGIDFSTIGDTLAAPARPAA
jgi:hypothetical protein